MRRGGAFHPQFFYHARPVIDSLMIARVQVSKPTGELASWTGTGMTNNAYEVVWEGHARIQPNKDWRARTREFAGEFDATQAIRVQLPVAQNELGAVRDDKGKIVSYGPDPEFAKDYIVQVIDSRVKGTERLEGGQYTVRNAISSSNAWVYNLLCDTGTKAGIG